MSLLAIVWDADPIAFELFGLSVRWYGLAYATTFLVGHWLLQRVFRREGKPDKDVDSLAITAILGVIIGARLGHCLFYHPGHYLANPIDILKVWEGGMASHGATAGLLLGFYLYARKHPGQSFLWITDRLIMVIALGAVLIRLGNLMNSEIVGQPAEVSWAFQFVNHSAPLKRLEPRHPSQLYEALAYFPMILFTLWGYFVRGLQRRRGLMTGIFLTHVFTARILIEFTKSRQAAFSADWSVSMGQLLSVPVVLLGAYLIYRALQQPPVEDTAPPDAATDA